MLTTQQKSDDVQTNPHIASRKSRYYCQRGMVWKNNFTNDCLGWKKTNICHQFRISNHSDRKLFPLLSDHIQVSGVWENVAIKPTTLLCMRFNKSAEVQVIKSAINFRHAKPHRFYVLLALFDFLRCTYYILGPSVMHDGACREKSDRKTNFANYLPIKCNQSFFWECL